MIKLQARTRRTRAGGTGPTFSALLACQPQSSAGPVPSNEMHATEPQAHLAGETRAEWSGPLFIVGMPRSGTKLLRGLLNRHPRIRVPDIETDFFPFLVRWVQQHGEPQSQQAFLRLYEEVRTATYFSFRPAHPPFTWQAWQLECEGRYDAASLFEAFVRTETGAARRSGIIWGDKSPAYIRHLGLLLEHFPDARVVHLVRDVRDYCVSTRKAWNKDIGRAAYHWGRDVAAAHELCRAYPQRCIEIAYEDLVSEPEVQLRRLSGLLGIDFSGAMTRLERPVEHLGDAAGRTEIVSDNVSKFAGRLRPREIRRIESLAWDTMNLLGYRPLYATRQKHLGKLEQRLLRVRDGLMLVAGAARRRGLAGALRFHLSHARVTR